MAPKSILENKNSKSKPGSHIPNLKTIEMIEEILAKEKEFSSRNKLSRALPKQVQQQTIEVVLEYLERSKKIMREDGAILWIFGDNNPKLMKLHKMSTELK
ncbi:hypothetical protein [Candidatus Nitrosotenuis sp. DW1]|uniref:hypothetical protein n=1 Tax=Candidatus Nitrosotenuis sp. DW1 TaxID=2259672 RepID=UPI0015CB3FD1|nr:hypothetical protein [Candidatus Nitrosotenuis sp. DW1]QLH09456.1 hypothetical protein DSQ19_08205 [Candidatus Nitrosotenuis sp. DW1]